jgi:hypothetical protein
MKLISIREFYEKDEQYLPGKKVLDVDSISVTVLISCSGHFVDYRPIQSFLEGNP